MDISVSSTLADRLASLTAKFDALEERLDALAENQSLHGEIQLEVVKLLQHIQGQQVASLERLNHVAEIQANTIEEGVSKEDVASLNALIAQEGRQRTLDLQSLKQTSNVSARQATAGKLPVRCAFIVHSIPMWDALSDVHAAMLQDERFDPVVISINSTPLGRGAFEGEPDVSRALDKLGVHHLRFNMEDSYAALDILKALRPAVIFRQQQWDACLPPAFHTPELTFARLCLVPYALNLATSLGDPVTTEVSAFGYDQAYHRAAWRIFCETATTQSYYRSFKHSDPDKIVLSGYPKFDRLLKSAETPEWPIRSRGGKPFRVIWAPHYSLGTNGLGFGVFDKIWDNMVAWARESRDIEFVLKPHPALFGQVLRGDGLAHVRKTWTSMPNCAIAEQQYGELFAASDLMISDGLSFLAEYQLFDKPLIFFDSGHHVAFNALGKMAEAATRRVRSFDQLKKATLEYKDGKTWEFETARKTLLNTLLPNRGEAAASILEAIAAGVLEDRH
ncbi:CDP-glycerol glycerophosphotransferase family protein [Mycoplana rhizolycopersici]|uniref:CDP-glycerol glycerophosphotransferase family protein n=1 Tax=Mycoplana rhizolycopersici TaxID=2746702 RepID=A0ABX2QD48_9HYPH|nr:CDP-glycerol glycerophosphotransferase family protein [Rhizobium rhizolycopersici]NVP55655.1 CDP-glycerol glycerophosphotransferase family protein [Rhizobium rhizolycopersici]